MARSEPLEAILRAQYELEYAGPEDLPRGLERLNALLDEAIAGTSLTRRELLSVLRDRYKEYKRAIAGGSPAAHGVEFPSVRDERTCLKSGSRGNEAPFNFCFPISAFQQAPPYVGCYMVKDAGNETLASVP